ncbi:MAG: amino acid permease [Ignavibacteriales bacterium]
MSHNSASNDVRLRRSITWLQGAALTTGSILGSGILVLPATAAVLAGPASLVSWVSMGLFAFPMALTLAALASRYPEAGGIAAYARRAFGPAAGTIAGWLFVGTVPVGGPVAALIGANYAGVLLSLSPLQVNLLAFFMLVLTLFFNYRGIELSGSVQVVVVSVIAVLLAASVFAAAAHVQAGAFTPFAPYGWRPVGVALTFLFWAFIGCEMTLHLAEEFKNPQRDIRISLVLSLVVIDVLYLAVAFVTIGTGAYQGPSGAAALARMVGESWGRWAEVVTAVLGFAVCYGTVHTYVAGFSRLVYAQARQGDFPAFFARLHPRFQTPYGAMLVLGPVFGLAISLNYLLGLNLNVLMQLPSATFILLYIVAMAAAFRLLPAGMGRWLAGFSLVACAFVYLLTGCAGLYPLAIGVAGWLVGSRRMMRGRKLMRQKEGVV